MRDHILCVDDDETALLTLSRQLEPSFDAFCAITTAHSATEAIGKVREIGAGGDALAVVICKEQLPDGSGLALLDEVQLLRPTVKTVLLAENPLHAASHRLDLQTLHQAGLSVYLRKPWEEEQLKLLVAQFLHAVRLQRQNDSLLATLGSQRLEILDLQQQMEARIHERTQALEEANRRLSQLAVTDGLTGLYNHRYLQEHLVLEVERSLRTGIPLGMLMIDVDHFRLYNNRFGHQTGDEVLRRVARLIAEHRRVNDVVARYGGEEFALLLINADHRVARRIADRLRSRVCAEPFPETRDMPGGTLTISIGVASCPSDSTTATGLISAADAALFRAKHGGRNMVCVAGDAEPQPPEPDLDEPPRLSIRRP